MIEKIMTHLKILATLFLLFVQFANAESVNSIDIYNKALIEHKKGDYKNSITLLEQAASHGLKEAQFTLGVMYYKGQGVDKDYKKAASWYEQAAKQGQKEAQFSLGVMYDEGLGVDQDYKKAAYWHEQTAKQGYIRSQLMFELLSLTKDIPQDPNKGFSLRTYPLAYLLVITALLYIFLSIPGTVMSFVTLVVIHRKRTNHYVALPEGRKYAGFWRRFIARAIDSAILYLSILVGLEPLRSHLTQTFSYPGMYDIILLSHLLLCLLIAWLYYALLQTSKYQATVGMMLMKFKIYDETLKKVGFWRLSGRYCSTILSSLILFFGFFMIGWTKRKQGLHDMIARTVCIKNK